ncbi:MAG TPA: protein kinase [Trebonia sp.]
MPALESLPGKVGPYRVVEKVGEGGMGVVYLARDVRGREVAVKVLGPALVGDPSARARLSREVETMRRVHSPFVAEVLDADTDGRAPYVVTRFVPGQTLDEAVRQDGPLRGVALQRFATGLARALVEIHAAGVVHRDLKPGNVMLSSGDPVVIDFGIAHVADATKLTQTGIVMGTPGYLAPEVITGEPSSPASDVHSWGATVAFAATGQAPFGTGTFQTIFFRVVNGQADLAGVPGALLPLVATALSPSPRNRPTAQLLAVQCARADMTAPAPPTIAMPGSASAWTPGGTLVEPPGVTGGGRNAGAMPGIAPPWSAGGESPGPQDWRRVRDAPQPAVAAAGVADLLPPVAYERRRANGQVHPQPQGPENRPLKGHGLVVLAVGVAAVALSIVLPVAGTLLALAAITLLRAADKAGADLAARRWVRGARPTDILVVCVTAPWTVVRAVLTTVVLAPLAVVVAALAAAASVLIGHTTSLPDAGSWAAGAAVAWCAVGPGSRAPRDQLRRISSGVLRSRASMAVGLIFCWALALAAFSSALAQPPLLWPAATWMLPHLPSAGSALHGVQQWLLRRAVRVLHLP